MLSILRPTKIAKFADFFHHLCDAIIDVILFMCFDAILECHRYFWKKTFDSMRFRLRLPSLRKTMVQIRQNCRKAVQSE